MRRIRPLILLLLLPVFLLRPIPGDYLAQDKAAGHFPAVSPRSAPVSIPKEALAGLQDAYGAASQAQWAADFATALLANKADACKQDVLDTFRREAKQRLDAYAILMLQTKSRLQVPLEWPLDLKQGAFTPPPAAPENK